MVLVASDEDHDRLLGAPPGNLEQDRRSKSSASNVLHIEALVIGHRRDALAVVRPVEGVNRDPDDSRDDDDDDDHRELFEVTHRTRPSPAS